MPIFKPSPLQQAIYHWVEHGTGSLIIEAVAGSGKTTTIVNVLDLIPSTLQVLFLAFNKSIALELAARVPQFVQVKTLNAAGARALGRFLGKFPQVNANKTRDIIRGMHLEDGYIPEITKLVALAKSHGIVPMAFSRATGVQRDDTNIWYELVDRYDLDVPASMMPYVIETVRAVLTASLYERRIIDFDDQLYMPVVLGANFERYDWLFVDEAQDVSPIQRAMLRKLLKPSGRLVAVGDPCQPTGTMVDVVVRSGNRWNPPIIEQRPIEKLKKGDVVVSMSPGDRQWNRCKAISGISSRPFSGDLVTVSAGDLLSKYTPNHHCYANFSPHRGRWCVYMMRRGDRYRIGKAKMDYGSVGSGLVVRYGAEKADGAWILSLHDSDAEALLREQVVSANFGIPQLMFEPANNSSALTADVLKQAWDQIDANEVKASACLSFHGRDIRYPLLNGSRNWKVSMKRPMVVSAANLMDGCLVLPYPHGSEAINKRETKKRHISKSDWLPITVSREPYSGLVWSMTVEKDHTYVGDGILTHNCQAIYGFRGADSASLGNIATEFGAIRMPLSISYRCPRAVVQYAQGVVSHIEASETAPEGSVQTWAVFDGSEFRSSDMIVCRNTAPLIKLAYGLIGKRIPATVLGRDIGAGLAKLIDRLKPKGIEGEHGLIAKLDKWVASETQKLLTQDKEDRVQAVEDKRDSILAFIDGAKATTVPKLKDEISSLFDTKQPNAVTLCTVHKSKGLEAKRVFVLDDHLMPSKHARQDWQKEQENNLRYVAYTRAQQDLIFITGDGLVENKAAQLNKEIG